MAQEQLFADDYKVTLDVFEGPLDLLLYLIRREELDIYDIPIEHITTEYMKFIEDARRLNLDIAGKPLGDSNCKFSRENLSGLSKQTDGYPLRVSAGKR